MRFQSTVNAILLAAAALEASAQSLGEAARKQAEKKKAEQPSARVYTEDDLAGYREGGPPRPSPAIADAAPEPAPSVRSVPDGEVGEAEWRSIAAAHRAAIRQAEQYAAAVQASIDRINSGLAGFPPQAHDTFAVVEGRKQKTLAQLERAKAQLAQLRQDRDAFEADARRRNVPPGWLRE